MKRVGLIALVIALSTPLIAGFASEERIGVTGFGGFPISSSMTSLWLVGPDRRPLLMVYFYGPAGWHNTQWKINSKFEKGKPGWSDYSPQRTCPAWRNNNLFPNRPLF